MIATLGQQKHHQGLVVSIRNNETRYAMQSYNLLKEQFGHIWCTGLLL